MPTESATIWQPSLFCLPIVFHSYLPVVCLRMLSSVPTLSSCHAGACMPLPTVLVYTQTATSPYSLAT